MSGVISGIAGRISRRSHVGSITRSGLCQMTREDIFIADMHGHRRANGVTRTRSARPSAFASPREAWVKPVTVWFKRISFVDGNGDTLEEVLAA